MSRIKQPSINSRSKKISLELTKLASKPFKYMKRITDHVGPVIDSTNSIFGQNRIITCSHDKTLRIFNLKEEKCERIIKYSTFILSVLYYEEGEVLMTTDRNGELIVWKLFPEIKIIKKIKVARPNSKLWRLTQISSTEFICCVQSGSSKGCLYEIKFNKKNEDFISKEIDYPPLNNNKKEDLRCLYQSITQKSIILFAGGNDGGKDFSIKSKHLNNNNNSFKRFQKNHSDVIYCLSSFIDPKDPENKEIILSGSKDQKIKFWSLKGQYLKEINFIGEVHSFLNDFSRNNIFVVGGSFNNNNLYSFSLQTEELEKKIEKIHHLFINCVKWVNEENQNKFISCSNDETFSIYQLEESNKNKNKNKNKNNNNNNNNNNVEEITLQNKKLQEEISKLKNLKLLSRIDLKIQEIEEEEYFYFNPTKYSTVYSKLEFHHNIGKINSIYVCDFQPSKSTYKINEDYLNKEVLSIFENVIVNQNEDKKLSRFLNKMKRKFSDRLKKHEKKIKEENEKNVINDIIKQVLLFFQPTSDKEEENEGEEEEEETPLTIFQANEKTVREETNKGIKKSAEKKAGFDNNVFIGDLENYYGVCRHRSTLFKVVCDVLNIRCKMIFLHGFHAWNIIQLKNEFFYVDLMNSHQIIEVEFYHNQVLRNIIKDPKLEGSTRLSIQEILKEYDLESEKTMKLREFYLEGKHKNIFEVLPTGKKGGGGDITLLRIKKTMKYRQDVRAIPSGTEIFKEREVLAVKKIKIRNKVEKENVKRKNEEEEEEDIRIDRKYAIRETESMKVLNHPSIIKIIGYFENEKQTELYLTMNCMDKDGEELIETLTDKKIEQNKVFIETILFFLEVARGLRYLSNLKLIHLDLKPQNVMINWDEEKNEIKEVKIIDFGGAKKEDILTSGMTTTKKYDSPEIKSFKESTEILKLFQKFKRTKSQKGFLTLRNRIELVGEAGVGRKRLENVFEYLVDLEKKNPKKYVLSKDWKETFKENLIFEKKSKLSDYDYRADIFSFGVMMKDFLSKNLLPFELEDLKEKCLRENRRDRCSIDEIIFVFRNQLSFFNRKMKEEEEKVTKK